MKKIAGIILITICGLFIFSCSDEDSIENNSKINNKSLINGIEYLKIATLNSEGQIDFYFTLEEVRKAFTEQNPGLELVYIDIIPNENSTDYRIFILTYDPETNEYGSIAIDQPVFLNGNIFYAAAVGFTNFKCTALPEDCGPKMCNEPKIINGSIKCSGCIDPQWHHDCRLKETKTTKLNFSAMTSVISMN